MRACKAVNADKAATGWSVARIVRQATGSDSGEYRIIYEHDEAELRVLIVGKRNDDDVYRRLRRMG